MGRTLCCDRERKVMGDSIFTRILSYTSAACDARMAGAMIPVMSNSGSGNQGIAATLPVVVYAEETHASEEQMIRALTLSHLTVIYIKQSLGRLSALCGCVVAATGSSCGITYLMGGGYGQAAAAVKNMIANLTGMICDGAKPSCAMKLTSGVSTAVLSAMMAMGRPLRHPGRGHHRGRCGQMYPQPHRHRPRRHERDRQPRTPDYDQQMLTMKYLTLKTRLLALLLLAATCAAAQPTPAQLAARPELTASIYHSYEYLPGPAAPGSRRLRAVLHQPLRPSRKPLPLERGGLCRAARRAAQSRQGRGR